ncbi:MAG TPA: CoA protein activase, partial [Firmicutes bacterium]|nr:CoA protein activase [Bacillota bacterium]
RILLADLGKEVEFITLEVPRGDFSLAWRRLRRIVGPTGVKKLTRGALLSWAKLKAIDEVENLSLRMRPREQKHGSTSTLLQQQLQGFRRAQSMAAIRRIKEETETALQDLTDPHQTSNILRVGLVGEIYVAAEPFVNLRLEERLGYLGVEVVRTIHLPQWVEDHIFKNALGLYKQRSLKRSAAGYLRGFVGGHGLESVARSVDLASKDLAGIIHIFPLSCMPEVIAQGILPQVSQDKKIPIMSLVVDEHGGEIGFQTRLEAFVDLLQRRVRRYVPS